MKNPRPKRPTSLRIYECHVGISSVEEKVNTYNDFAENVLPRIQKLGYNAIQVPTLKSRVFLVCFLVGSAFPCASPPPRPSIFFNYSFLALHPINWDDRHLLA
jgi:hypothetical protein